MNSSSAAAINNAGQVVGDSGGNAFLWDPEEGMTEIVEQGWDLQINDLGVVVGRANVAIATGQTASKMFVWSATDGVTMFGPPFNPPKLREFLIDNS